MYAIFMGKPLENEILLSEYHELPKSVELLETHQKLECMLSGGKLRVMLKESKEKIDGMFVLKIEIK